EGHPTQRTVLIENGILKNYMVDWLGGRRMGLPSTGSGRRESYRYAPVSRMRNTFIAPGPDENEAILRSMDRGL
ncbi:metallopeptidase TldD-related protein, partial [Bacteroides uniformis]